MRKTNELQTAYVHFAHAVGRLLESKGAGHDHGVYTLDTPGGPLMLRPVRNWVFGRFANPVGGFIVTDGLSQEHCGKWNTNFHDDAEALTNPDLLAGFEFDLDNVLGFAITAEQREAIYREAAARLCQAAADDQTGIYGEPPIKSALDKLLSTGRLLNQAAAMLASIRFDGTSTPRPIIH